MWDDGNGVKPKEGLGTIIVRIYRVKVTGPWQGKLTPASVAESKPIMVGEKHGPVNLEHRVVYQPLYTEITLRFSPPTQMKTAVKPQSTEWIDSKGGPPFAEFIFHYRSKGWFLFISALMVERLREMGILPAKSLLEEKAERSEFSDAKESGSQRKSFWTFWSKWRTLWVGFPWSLYMGVGGVYGVPFFFLVVLYKYLSWQCY